MPNEVPVDNYQRGEVLLADTARSAAIREKLARPTGGNKMADRAFRSLVLVFSLAMVVPLVLILGFIVAKGVGFLSLALFIHDERGGGILNALVGSLLMVLVATVIAVPISILTGLYLSEHRTGRRAEFVRLMVDVLQGVPSIILGIIAYVWIVVPFHAFSALAGGIALSIMMMPVVIKNTEESLKLVPPSLKEAAYAVGAPRWKALLEVVLPAGASGVMTGILVGVARVLGETAPLLFTAFGNRDFSLDPTKPMEALPPLIFKYATSPDENWINTAWAASFVLVVFVLTLNLTTKVVTRKWRMPA
jgi:phosphate transport system permease protein